jgi:hypothetical protein
MAKKALLLLIVTAAVVAASLASAVDPSFDSYWHDGQAELDGYRLRVSRYGQEREGTCVMVYVTEPFSESKRVKVDDPNANPDDTFDAFKLNLIRDFQTGIYDYNTMVSVFDHSRDFKPAKLSFSSAEWCGHVYEEIIPYADKIHSVYYSYFENESGSQDLPHVDDGIFEDNLYILLRGLRGEFLAAGETKAFRIIPSLYSGRLLHKPLEWATADITRRATPERIRVPAGEFETIVYDVKVSDGRTGLFFVETAYPHRIVAWEMPPDVRGELSGTDRLQYWKLHNNGDESYLKNLGLGPLAR